MNVIKEEKEEEKEKSEPKSPPPYYGYAPPRYTPQPSYSKPYDYYRKQLEIKFTNCNYTNFSQRDFGLV